MLNAKNELTVANRKWIYYKVVVMSLTNENALMSQGIGYQYAIFQGKLIFLSSCGQFEFSLRS
jgi:hypothetical protein